MRPYEAAKGWERVVRHAFVLLGGSVVSALLALATLSMTARALAPAAFGILVIAQAYGLLVERIGTFQSWQTIIRFGALAREQGDDATLHGLIRLGRRLDLAGALLGSTFGVAIAMLAGHRFGWDQSTTSMAAAYGGSVLFRMSGTSLAVLRLFDRFDRTAIARAASGIVKLSATGIAILSDAPLPVFVAVWIVGDIVPSALMALFAMRTLSGTNTAAASPLSVRALRDRFPDMLGMFRTTNFHSTIKVVARDCDVLVAGLVGGPAVAGAVRVARQIGSAMGQLSDPLAQAIYPELSAAAANGNPDQVRALTLRAARWGAGVGAVIVAGFAILAPTLLHLFAGETYAANAPALLCYALAQALALSTLAVSPALLALGRAQRAFQALCIATAAYAVLLVPAVWQWGATGAGAALVAYQVINGFVAARGVMHATARPRPSATDALTGRVPSLTDQHAT
jgi:O-antigen/teichoic acid export membrane protein